MVSEQLSDHTNNNILTENFIVFQKRLKGIGTRQPTEMALEINDELTS